MTRDQYNRSLDRDLSSTECRMTVSSITDLSKRSKVGGTVAFVVE